jgi:hypothetical protein
LRTTARGVLREVKQEKAPQSKSALTTTLQTEP